MESSREVEFSSAKYWQSRYERGGTSGIGSYGKLAEFKAEVINDFIKRHKIKSVLDLGCGDGNQASLLDVDRYLGLDVSEEAIDICVRKFNGDFSRKFALYQLPFIYSVDMSMSLDVIFHLVEDGVYKQYMKDLFRCSRRFVCVYSSNTNTQVERQGEHMKQRRFTDDVDDRWKLIEKVPNKYPYNPTDGSGSLADFYFFQRNV